MHVTKLRAANDNGLVPAGHYFARLTDNLRAAAIVDEYEAQERKIEACFRKPTRKAAARTPTQEQHAPLM